MREELSGCYESNEIPIWFYIGIFFALWENLFLVNQKSFNRRISFFKIKFIKRRKKHEHKRNDE
jgi:hypothetical protein